MPDLLLMLEHHPAHRHAAETLQGSHHETAELLLVGCWLVAGGVLAAAGEGRLGKVQVLAGEQAGGVQVTRPGWVVVHGDQHD